MSIDNNSASHRVWIEDGILFEEFCNEVNLEAAVDLEKQALKLLEEQNIKTLPLIAILKDIGRDQFKFSMADYARILNTVGMVSHISGIWIVVNREDVKKPLSVFNKLFLLNRMHIVDKLQEALEGAHKLKLQSESILEKG